MNRFVHPLALLASIDTANGMTPEDEKQGRTELIEGIAAALGIANYAVRGFANGHGVTIEREDEIEEYLVLITTADDNPQISHKLCDAAGIAPRNPVKPQHRPSSETMAKFYKSAGPDNTSD